MRPYAIVLNQYVQQSLKVKKNARYILVLLYHGVDGDFCGTEGGDLARVMDRDQLAFAPESLENALVHRLLDYRKYES